MNWDDEDDRVRYGLYTARKLADPRFFPDQEAKAYVLRFEYDVPVGRISDELDISESRVYNASNDGKNRLEAIRDALNVVDTDEFPVPDQCRECGTPLQQWTIDERGRALCKPCGEVDD